VTGFVGEDARMTSRRAFLASLAAACATEPAMRAESVFELRNYLMRPGQRDVLIELFEREFIESQEALGACVVGTFRDLDDADRFVWIRSFGDFPARYAALDAFYASPIWQTHRTAANATMVDSDNVLLLRPHSGALLCDAGERSPIGASAIPRHVIVATSYFLSPGGEEDFAAFFEDAIAPRVRQSDGDLLATFVSEQRTNNYPRLPVREDVNAFVSLMRFSSLAEQIQATRALGAIGREIERRVVQTTETLRLQPTARSLLR
jgi:hypothetical protein